MYIHLNVCKQMDDIKLFLLHTNTWNYLILGKQMINSLCNNLYWIEITKKHLTLCKKKELRLF